MIRQSIRTRCSIPRFSEQQLVPRRVFDWTSGDPAPEIKVKSLTPGDAELSDVENADLIVLTNGRDGAVLHNRYPR